ncbi:protein containing Calx-beta domain [Beggiatoa sp. PS]|nr:protein containing Calx-beta domain [Beggiatoa sp. PS]
MVRSAMLLLNDGGALVLGSDGNQIIGNFFLNSVGNVDESNGCGSVTNTPCMHHHSYGMGIGANNNLKDQVIEGNTVANNAHQGIRLNAFINTIVRNNTAYNNKRNQLVIEDKKGPSSNNIVEGNIIYPLGPDQNGLELTNMTDHGTFDNNYYCNPYSEIVLIRDKKRYALAHWQSTFSPYEQNSRWCGITAEEYSVSSVGTNLILNSTFDADVLDWKGSGASDIFHDTTQAQMDGGSLKSIYNGTTNANVIPNSFALTTGQYYRLKFSVVGNGFGRIKLRINRVENGTTILAERFFAYDPNRKDYEMFFQSPVTTSTGKILFTTTQDDADTYWLDNVTFEPVTVVLNDATQQSPLFINPTALSKTISLGSTTYYDLEGNPVTGNITLAPFSSQILVTSAPPPPPPVTMTISHLGNGSGTVTSTGINCGVDCTETYTYGTPITLTATPNADSIFTGWTGTGCSGNVTITTHMSCTANFALSNHTLTLNKAGTGNGTINSVGINCGTDCAESYVNGTAVNLTVIPDANSTFTSWTGTGCSGNFAITSDMSCTATFTLSNETLTVNKAGTGNGTISSVGINCGTDCTESYVNGTAVNLTVIPDANSTFTNWTGIGCASNFAITSDMSCTANFALSNYTLTLNKAGTGSGIVSSTGIDCGIDCAESYVSGTAVILTTTPAADSIFTGWTGTGCADSLTITADMNCTATFDLIPISPVNYTLTINQTGTGSGSVSSTGIDCGSDCTESYVSGSAITLTATPVADSIFTGWTGTNCADSFNITTDMNCTATFVLIPASPVNYTLTVIKAGTGSGTVSSTGIDCGADCAESYVSGSAITLTATPATDSTFTGWTGTGCADSFNITTDMNCTATFDLIPVSPVNYTLTVNSAAGTGSGSVSSTGIDCGADCTESYVSGSAITLTATPATDSIFTGWTGTNCADSFNLTADMNCTATFELIPASPVNYILIVNQAGSGSGTVSSTGIDCGIDCAESYVNGTAITLTTTPAKDSTFSGWSGVNCANSFNITADMNCTATFDLNPVSPPPSLPSYALMVNTIGSGKIISNPTGIACGADCIRYYASGTMVTLTAIPDNGMNFTSWAGACSDSSNSIEVFVNSEKTCTAQFEPIESSSIPDTSVTYPLTITTIGNGIITSEPAGITCGENCLADYATDTVVTLSVNLLAGNVQFVGFSGDADCLDGSVTMNQPMNCVASFETFDVGTEIPNDNIGENATDNGTNTPVNGNGDNTTDNSTNTSVDNNVQPSLGNYRLTMTTMGNGIVNSEPVGIICGEDCIEDYPKDTVVAFTATLLDDNTQFIGFSGDADCSDGLVTMNQSLDCIAIFEPITVISDEVNETASDIVESDNEVSISPITLPMNYFLTITRIGNGYVSSEPAGILCGDDCIANYPSDTMINFTVGLEANTQFLGFTGDPDCSDGVVILTKPTHCIATFQALNPGYIQFAADEYNISEEAEQLIVTVKRLGGYEGTVIVNYATKDNTAIAGHDYVDIWGTLKWEDGDKSDRILTIPLLDNEENDGDKTFTLALFGFSGNQVTVTIWDNEMQVTEPVEAGPVEADERTCPTSDLVEEVCNAQGQTLSNLRIAQAGQLENAVLEGNVINNGWISNATIQADTTLSGGIVSGYISNQGLMENFEFRGARVRGGTLKGLITNTQDGAIEDVLLAASAEINGGQVAGNIHGDAEAPAQLNHLTVQAGTTLSHVIIGDNVQVPSNVSLGRGVRFANRQPIPTELELITVLPALPTLTCVEQGTMPESVDLRADVWQPSDGILPHINELSALIDNGWEITQEESYGYLQLTIADWHYAVQPMSIKYTTAPANLQVQDNQSTRFLIDGGLDILTQPAVQAPCDLLAALENMGLSDLMGQTNGNLKIPASDNSWYSARPHFASVALTTDTEPGLYLSESPIVTMGLVAALVFIDEEGIRRQQAFYPGLAVPEALYASAQEIVIEPYGLVNFKLEGQSYRGVVDYLVTSSSLPVPEKVQIIPLSDINQDGTADFALLYPTGEQQSVFAMP